MDERLKDIVDNFDNMKTDLHETFNFHCTMCGNCCINLEDILLSPKDIYSMSSVYLFQMNISSGGNRLC